MAVGYLAAFLGGLLTLLSPCGALMLPGFFAYAFDGAARLLARTGILYLGLLVTLVPLGMGAAQASRLVFGHQAALATVAGILLIGFGVLQLLGRGFTLDAFSAASRLRERTRGASVVAVFVLGATAGLTGFCTGPLLGAVLTVAASTGQALRGGALLAVYAAGMAAPLFLLALLWDRYDLAERRWLRGRGIRVGPLTLHSTSVVSGLIFIGLGALFLANRTTGGLLTAVTPAAIADWAARAQLWIATAQAHVPDLALIAIAAVAIITITWRMSRTATRVPRAPAAPEVPHQEDPRKE